MTLKLFAALSLAEIKEWDYSSVPEEIVPWTKGQCRDCGRNSESNHEVCLYMMQKTKDKEFLALAAMLGRLDLVKSGFEDGFSVFAALSRSARYGRIECVKYLCERGCKMGEMTCSLAAMGGHIDCIKYLREQGCPWNEGTTWFAGEYGHLDCLKYLHENGCPWDHVAIVGTVAKSQVECLEYLFENGCPIDTINLWVIWIGAQDVYWKSISPENKERIPYFEVTDPLRCLRCIYRERKRRGINSLLHETLGFVKSYVMSW